MPHFSQKQVLILIGVAVVLLGVVFLIFSNLKSDDAPPAVSLTVWGIEDKEVMETSLDGYGAFRPNVTITYTQWPAESYEEELLDALAAGRGPDIYMLPNRSVSRQLDRLAPAPASQLTYGQLRDYFPQAVEQDFVRSGDIYALPLYLDTLALFYNRDMFDQAALTAPPRTWQELQSFIPYLRRINAQGQVEQAAAAIGGTELTVAHAADILALLMLQNGATITDTAKGAALFAEENGVQAFDFYLQFANPAADAFTWSESMPRSLDAFLNNRAALVFGYARDAAALKARSPFLNMGIAAMPQVYPEQAVNFPDYWGLAVSRQSQAAAWAWDYVIFAATNLPTAQAYATATARPPALKTLIGQMVNDDKLGVFVRQALTARSFPDPDEKRTVDSLNSAIGAALSGQLGTEAALRRAQDQITQNFRR